MKSVMMAVLMAAVLAGCAALQPEVKATATAPPPFGDHKTISVPNWPMLSYVSAENDAFVVLGVKNPQGFPVPGELEFKSKDGKIVKKLKPIAQPAAAPPAQQAPDAKKADKPK